MYLGTCSEVLPQSKTDSVHNSSYLTICIYLEYVSTHVYIYVYIGMHIHLCVYKYTSVYIYIYIYMHYMHMYSEI